MPLRGYVSASQVPALFDASPYMSKFALWHYHATGADIDPPDDARMGFGRALQNVILEGVAERMHWDLVPNPDDVFEIHPDESLKLGATVDCRVRGHESGPGVVEVKNVDRIVWLQEWTKEKAPPHIELQLQTQLMVERAPWGAIAAFIGGNELRVYERVSSPTMAESIERAVRAFWGSVERGDEPDPMASDLGLLADLFPEIEPDEVTRTDSAEINSIAQAFHDATETRKYAEKARDDAKAKLLHAMGAAGTLLTLDYAVKVSRSVVPAHTRKESTRTLVKAKLREEAEGGPFLG